MLPRTLEPEVMDDPARAQAYADADFSAVNQAFVDRLMASFPDLQAGRSKVLDLGCGPAGIPIRLARAAPSALITAVDASADMLRLARIALRNAELEERVRLLQARLPGLQLPREFDAVISNSLVHHLPDPTVFWKEIRRLGCPGAAVFVMDLFRPESAEHAAQIVEDAATGEHPLLKEDFYNSLLAALAPEEIDEQLIEADMPELKVRIVSERHWLVAGRL